MIALVPNGYQGTVDTLIDEFDGDLRPGDVSLREAVAFANESIGEDQIRFDASLPPEPILLSAGQIEITNSLQILGLGSGSTLIDAQGNSRVFNVQGPGVDLAVDQLGITGGSADAGNGPGGAIQFQSDGTLRVSGSRFSNHQGSTGGAIWSDGDLQIVSTHITDSQATSGGAVYATGQSLSVVASTLDNNQATGDGGAVHFSGTQMGIVGSTISNNRAGANGGGVFVDKAGGSANIDQILSATFSANTASRGAAVFNASSLLDILSSTIAENTATSGDSAAVVSRDIGGTRTTIGSSIIAENGPRDIASDVASPSNPTIQSSGLNLIHSVAPGVAETFDTTEFPNDEIPLIQPLGFYGGINAVHPLADGSPALDGGRSNMPADQWDLDQDGDTSEPVMLDGRGSARLVDLDTIADVSGGGDVGAVEMIGLAVGDAVANESQGTIEFALTLTNPLPAGSQTSVLVSTIGQTATPGLDLDALIGKAIDLPTDEATEFTFAIDLTDDDLIEPDESFRLRLQSTGGITLATTEVTGQIISDDIAGFIVSKSSLTASESGHTEALTVVLTAQPTQDVQIDLTLDRDDEVQLNRTSLLFTPGNWDEPQEVVATAINDQLIDETQTSVLTLGIRSDSDPSFQGVDDQLVQIRTTDNDFAGVTVHPLGGLVTTEAGEAMSFSIRLDALPQSDVIVRMHVDDATEASLNVTEIVFTPDDGTTPRNVIVTGLDDEEIDGNIDLQVVIEPLESDDANFAGLNPTDVALTNLDDDRLDYGDAIDPDYPSLLASDGARHGGSSLFLGDSIDFENDAQISPFALGDLGDDGVRLATSLATSASSLSLASLRVTSSEAGRLDAWLDFNSNGSWGDPGEQIVESIDLGAGENLLTIAIPAGATQIQTAARFRLSTNGGLSPQGQAADGEVEDYIYSILGSQDDLEVLLPRTMQRIDLGGTTLSIADQDQVRFQATVSDGQLVEVGGTDQDDQFLFDFADLPSLTIIVDGGDGLDTLVPLQNNAPLPIADHSGAFNNFEAIDIRGRGSSIISLSEQSILATTGGVTTLTVHIDESDRLDLRDPWTLQPVIADGTFTQVIEMGTARVHVDGATPWTNPIDPLDVNASGVASSIDALTIINQLSRRDWIDDQSTLLDPATATAEFPDLYYDTNRDTKLTPLDALIVLNSLQPGAGASEQALIASPQSFAGHGIDEENGTDNDLQEIIVIQS